MCVCVCVCVCVRVHKYKSCLSFFVVEEFTSFNKCDFDFFFSTASIH